MSFWTEFNVVKNLFLTLEYRMPNLSQTKHARYDMRDTICYIRLYAWIKGGQVLFRGVRYVIGKNIGVAAGSGSRDSNPSRSHWAFVTQSSCGAWSTIHRLLRFRIAHRRCCWNQGRQKEDACDCSNHYHINPNWIFSPAGFNWPHNDLKNSLICCPWDSARSAQHNLRANFVTMPSLILTSCGNARTLADTG